MVEISGVFYVETCVMCVLGVKIGLIAGRFIINLFIAKLTITKKMPKDGGMYIFIRMHCEHKNDTKSSMMTNFGTTKKLTLCHNAFWLNGHPSSAIFGDHK